MNLLESRYRNTVLINPEAAEPEKEKEEDEKKRPGPVSDRLLKARQIFLSSDVNSKTADQICKQLLVLETDDPGKPITFFINSPGGSVYDGFAIFDMMKFITSPVRTVVAGLAASFGTILAIGAQKGNRYALPNSKFMVHQPLIAGAVRGSATDIEIETKEMIRMKNHLIDLYVEATGRPADQIRRDLERNKWLDVNEARDYGLIDHVISGIGELPDMKG